MAQIQRRGRLIEQQQRRLLDAHSGKGGACLFAAGQGHGIAAGQMQDFHIGHGLRDAGVILVRREIAQGASHGDDFIDSIGEAQHVVLWHHGAPGGKIANAVLRDGAAFQSQFALAWETITGHQSQQGRFSCAIGADQSRQAAGWAGQRDVFQQLGAIERQ